MHKTMLTGVAAAAALTLLAVAPASAETTTETTVTTSIVPADTATAIPDDYDVWGDAGRLTDADAVEFPLDALKYDGDFIHSTFGMSAEAPEGCVRVVESFTFGYTLADDGDVDLDAVSLAGGVGTGEPLVLATLAAPAVTHTGDGAVDVDGDRVWVDLESVLADPEPQSGVVTMAYAAPVAPDEARGYVGFGVPYFADWIVDRAEFRVTDTCTSEVEIPVVVPPVVDPPVVDPPVVEPPVVVPPVLVPPVVEPPVVVPPVVDPPVAVPPVVVPPVAAKPAAVVTAEPLAETGVDAGLVGTAAVLLLGAGAAGLLLARRRASN